MYLSPLTILVQIQEAPPSTSALALPAHDQPREHTTYTDMVLGWLLLLLYGWEMRETSAAGNTLALWGRNNAAS